jgi:hypothetical protein
MTFCRSSRLIGSQVPARAVSPQDAHRFDRRQPVNTSRLRYRSAR